MKNRATILIRRLTSGDVVGEIIDSSGKVVMSRNFGKMTNDEIERVVEAYKIENPEADVLPSIEITQN
jgi:hypothetical protein